MLVALSDYCIRQGLVVPAVEPATVQKLQEISPPIFGCAIRWTSGHRPQSAGWSLPTGRHGGRAPRSKYRRGRRHPHADTRDGVPPYDFIVDLAKKYPEKPVLVGFSAAQDCIEECKAYLEPRGVPTFLDIEQPFEVLSILARCYRAMTRVQTGVTDNGAVASR